MRLVWTEKDLELKVTTSKWFLWSSLKYLGNYKLCHLRKTISDANFCSLNHLFFRLHSAVRIKKSINYLKSLWLHFILLLSLLWRRKPLTWAKFLFLFLKSYLNFFYRLSRLSSSKQIDVENWNGCVLLKLTLHAKCFVFPTQIMWSFFLDLSMNRPNFQKKIITWE